MAKKKKIVYQIPDEALPLFFHDQGFTDEEVRKLINGNTGKAFSLSEIKREIRRLSNLVK